MDDDVLSPQLKGHEDAIAELSALLQTPESLEKVPQLLQEYMAKKAAVDDRLRAMLDLQVGRTQEGMQQLQQSQSLVSDVRTNFEMIDSKCQEVAILASGRESQPGRSAHTAAKQQSKDEVHAFTKDEYTEIKRVNTVRDNIHKTSDYVRRIRALPKQCAFILDILQDRKQLLRAYRKLMKKVQMRDTLLYDAAQTNLPPDKLQALKDCLQPINDVFRKLQRQIIQVIDSCMSEEEEDNIRTPQGKAMLVSVVRIIDLHNQYEAAAGDEHNEHRADLEGEVIQTFSKSLNERFDLRWQRAGPLRGSHQVNIDTLLEGADQMLDELDIIKDHMTPCFPLHDCETSAYKFHVFLWHADKYNKAIYARLSDLLKPENVDELNNYAVLEIIKWIRNYPGQVRRLGMQDDDLVPKLDDLKPIAVRAYSNKTYTTLNRLTTNATQNEFDDTEGAVKKSSETHHLYTTGPTDTFRTINTVMDNLDRCDGYLQAKLMMPTIETITSVLQDVVNATENKLESATGDGVDLNKCVYMSVEPEFLCAMLNNQREYLDQIADMRERALAMMRDAQDGVADATESLLHQAELEFHRLAKRLVVMLLDSVFEDVQVSDLFTEAWYSFGDGDEGVMERNLLTLADYNDDIQEWLDPIFFKQYVDKMLDKLVGTYVDAMLCNSTPTNSFRYVGETADGMVECETSEIMRNDQQLLETHFSTIVDLVGRKLVNPSKARDRLKVISCLAGLLEASPDLKAKELSLHCNGLFEFFGNPDTLQVYKHVIDCRKDIKSKKAAFDEVERPAKEKAKVTGMPWLMDQLTSIVQYTQPLVATSFETKNLPSQPAPPKSTSRWFGLRRSPATPTPTKAPAALASSNAAGPDAVDHRQSLDSEGGSPVIMSLDDFLDD